MANTISVLLFVLLLISQKYSVDCMSIRGQKSLQEEPADEIDPQPLPQGNNTDPQPEPQPQPQGNNTEPQPQPQGNNTEPQPEPKPQGNNTEPIAIPDKNETQGNKTDIPKDKANNETEPILIVNAPTNQTNNNSTQIPEPKNNQTEPKNNQTEPQNNQTEPKNNQTEPQNNQTKPTNETKPMPAAKQCVVVAGCTCTDLDNAKLIKPMYCDADKANCHSKFSQCINKDDGSCGWKDSAKLDECINSLGCAIRGCSGEICANIDDPMPEILCPKPSCPKAFCPSIWKQCLRKFPKSAPKCLSDKEGRCKWANMVDGDFWCCVKGLNLRSIDIMPDSDPAPEA